VCSRPLGEHGIHATLYAAIRDEQRDHMFIRDFMTFARQTCFANLEGIEPVGQSR